MAAGDFVSAATDTSGWFLDIKLSGLATGGTYSGLAGNNLTTGLSAINVVSVSKGFDNAGSATTISRSIVGTTAVWFPYSTVSITGAFTLGTFSVGETITQGTSGATAKILFAQSAGTKLYARTVTGTPDSNPAHTWVGGTSSAVFAPTATPSTLAASTPWESFDGTNTTVRIALSDYIYQKDNTGGGNSGTAPTIAITGTFYTSGGTPNGTRTAIALTNNSTMAYPVVIANFVSLPYKLLNGAFTVECQAFHRHGQNTFPVSCVKFTLADGTVTRAQTITAMSKSADADLLPVYAASDTATNFTQDAQVTCKIQAYPWVGDTTEVADSSANAFMNTGMNLANLPVGVCDKGNTYVGAAGGTFCAVNATTGNDANLAFATQAAAEAAPVQNFSKALKRIQDFNNATYGRNNVDGGVILLASGGHSFGVNAETITVNSKVACIVTRATGTTRAQATIVAPYAGGGRFASGAMRLYDITLAPSSGANQNIGFTQDAALVVVENCIITGQSAATKIWSSNTLGKAAAMYKNCTISNYTNGISTGNDNCALLARGVTISGVDTNYAFSGIKAVVGCTLTDNLTTASFYHFGAKSWTDAGNIILSYNIAKSLSNIFMDTDTDGAIDVQNIAVVCNVAERIGGSSSPLFEASATNISNLQFWHNTMAGQRVNTEGDIVSAPFVNYTYKLNGYRYNSWYYNGTHSPGDVFCTDGSIVNQWPYSQYDVGWAGNNSEIVPDQSPGNYLGLLSTHETAAGYTLDASVHGTGAGGGDYIPTSVSVLRNKIQSGLALIPYDLLGVAIPNAGTGAAGAYQFPSGGGGTATWRQGGANVLSGNLIGQAGVFGVLV
jgi:hypothetical protein